MKPGWRWVQASLAVAIFAVAIVLLWRQAHTISLSQLQAAWARTPASAVAWCIACSALSLTCLAIYEAFATRCAVPGRVPVLAALRIGAMSHAIANTLGFQAVTGVALRHYFYRRYGLGIAEVTRIVAMVALCVGSGVALVLATALWRLGPAAGEVAAIAVPIAVTGLLVALGVLVWRRRRAQGDARIPARLACTMLVVSWLEMAAAIAALRVLLPESVAIGWAPFVLLFVGAMLVGLLSHVPGSVGVFETAILSGLPHADPATVLIALMAYRLIYNLSPFLIALPALAIDALRMRRRRASVRRRI